MIVDVGLITLLSGLCTYSSYKFPYSEYVAIIIVRNYINITVI